jgi:AcrR family transcriptional regulator
MFSTSAERETRRQRALRYRPALEKLLAGGATYAELDVRELAIEADSSRSSFYVHFEDKVDFVRAVGESIFDEALDTAAGMWSRPPAATKAELGERLAAMFEGYRREALIGAVLVEVASYDARAREQYVAVVEATRRMIQTHVEDGQRSGAFRTGIDAEMVGIWFTSMLSRGALELVRPAKAARLSRLLTALTDIIWNTLYIAAG